MSTPIPSFAPGVVLRTAARAVAANLPAVLALTALLVGPAVFYGLTAGHPAAGLKGGKANAAVIIYVVKTGAIALSLAWLLAGALAPVVVAAIEGRRLAPLAAIRDGLLRLAPAIGAELLAALVVSLGLIALVVPGVMLLGLLHVAVPAAVVEGSTGAAALRRGAALARPRWPWLAAFALAPSLLAGGLTLGLARLIVPHVAAGKAQVPAPQHWTLFAALTVGLAVLAVLVAALTAAVGYRLLRADAERR
jgi:hypothetical protein